MPPPPPASISPTSDNPKHPNRRSRKSERPLPTKALPVSSVTGSEASSMPSTSNADSEQVPSIDKGITPRTDEDCVDVTSSSAVSDTTAKDVVKDKTEKDEKSVANQLLPASDQNMAFAESSASGTGASSTAAYVGATSRVPPGDGTEGLPALLPGRVSLLSVCSCLFVSFLFLSIYTSL